MKTTLTTKQKAIIAKYEPKTAKGTEIGSFYGNKKACAYEFCGGKSKYDEKLYKLGQKAFMEAYDNDETWERLNGVKPTKTARGTSSSKKAPKSLEARVDALENKLDLILAKLG
jgi:hypothetical protein